MILNSLPNPCDASNPVSDSDITTFIEARYRCKHSYVVPISTIRHGHRLLIPSLLFHIAPSQAPKVATAASPNPNLGLSGTDIRVYPDIRHLNRGRGVRCRVVDTICHQQTNSKTYSQWRGLSQPG